MTREEAIQELTEWREQMKNHGVPNWSAKLNALNMATEALSAEAVQGEWIMHGEPPWYVRECSKCGTKWHQWSGDSNPNFCGHCGAKMKGGAE